MIKLCLNGKLVIFVETVAQIKYGNITDRNVILNMIVLHFPELRVNFSVQSCVCHVSVLSNARDYTPSCLWSVNRRMLTIVYLMASSVINNKDLLKIPHSTFK